MNFIDKLKNKAESMANNPVLSQKDKSFIKTIIEKWIPTILFIFQALITVYIFRKVGARLGFLETIVIQLAVIMVILRKQ